jgi:hypothetical protein
MFLRTSGNKADTSFPKVIAMMVFWMDSFRSYAYCETSPALSSNVSPFLGGVNALFTLFIAILKERSQTAVVGGSRGSIRVGFVITVTYQRRYWEVERDRYVAFIRLNVIKGGYTPATVVHKIWRRWKCVPACC